MVNDGIGTRDRLYASDLLDLVHGDMLLWMDGGMGFGFVCLILSALGHWDKVVRGPG